jgi:hypothetical protein
MREKLYRHCRLHQVPVITTDELHTHSWTAHGGLIFQTIFLPLERPRPELRWMA